MRKKILNLNRKKLFQSLKNEYKAKTIKNIQLIELD